MLNHPTLDKIQKLKLTGMTSALTDQMSATDIDELDFMERLGLLVERESRQLTACFRRARLKHGNAALRLDKRLM